MRREAYLFILKAGMNLQDRGLLNLEVHLQKHILKEGMTTWKKGT